MARRSTAIGWCSASIVKQRLSISMCSLLIGPSLASIRSTSWRVARDQTLDGASYAIFGEAAHFEQPCLELFQLLLKMPVDAFRHQPNLPVT